jgi:uncharacterized protein (TIGR03435 family)
MRLAALFGITVLLAAQQFEVVSIKPSSAAATAGTSFELQDRRRLRIVNEPSKLLIRVAFQLQNTRIADAPEWVERDRFDIDARTGRPEKIAQGEVARLLQSLLADRFQMKSHFETRALPVYALVVRTAGKLKVSGEGDVAGMSTSSKGSVSQARATATSMELFEGYVGNRLGEIVLDQTGLNGAYNFTLQWSANQSADSTAPSLTTALREQLGLSLERKKSPMKVLVIDAMSRPSVN